MRASAIIRFPSGRPAARCAFCGQPSQGNYGIHRDGFGEGPEVDLCDECGQGPSPTCEEIWEGLRRIRDQEQYQDEVLALLRELWDGEGVGRRVRGVPVDPLWHNLSRVIVGLRRRIVALEEKLGGEG